MCLCAEICILDMATMPSFSTLVIAADEKLRYTVPRSEKSADEIMQLCNIGRHPLVIPLDIDRWVNCFHCLTFGYLLSVFPDAIKCTIGKRTDQNAMGKKTDK